MTPERWEHVVRIYQQALDIPESARNAFVADASAGDEELRHEVASLFAQDSHVGILDRPMLATAAEILANDATLPPGSQLGPYHIECLLGSGGMGHVYRATDTRLHRPVAIKVLHRTFIADPQRRERFDREAKVIASLTHPHICALYDVRSESGIDFLVLEYLEGDTLATRLERGALRRDQALRLAIEIGEALAAAHRRGIVHRDVKPGNIILTTSGAKLLDFGLATRASTSARDVTAEGTIAGTVSYMAPEQLDGREADARSDIFAFGAVVYEMLTGQKASTGPRHTLAPPLLDHIVHRCLANDPDERWQSAADLARELRWVMDAESRTPPRSDSVARPSRVWAASAGLVAGLVMATIATTSFLRRPNETPRVTRFDIEETAADPLSRSPVATGLADRVRNFAVTHDGSRVVFRLGSGSQGVLAVRSMDRVEVKPIEGSAGANQPFFSPDDTWIGFHSAGRLKKVRLSGGAPVELCAMGAPGRGASWAAGDTIVFATTDPATGLLRISAGGGTPTELTTPDTTKGERDHWWPYVLSDDRVVFTVISENQPPQIVAIDLKTGVRNVLVRNGQHPQYVEHDRHGYLLYESETTLYAARFDKARLALTGNAVPVVSDMFVGGLAASVFGVSNTGTLVYAPNVSTASNRSLVWVDRSGREQSIDAPPRAYMSPRLSPDETLVAVVIANPDPALWTWNLQRKDLTPVESDAGHALYPVWAPGHPRQLLFMSERAGSPNLFRHAADGSGSIERLITTPRPQYPSSVSRDGVLFFTQLSPPTQGDIAMLDLKQDPRGQLLINTRAMETNPEISPDGKWLVYQSNESGQDEIWVKPFPIVGGPRYKISIDGGLRPAWSRDGNEILYLDPRHHLTSVAVIRSGATLTVNRPTTLFDTSYFTGVGRPYDVARDGRFLMVKENNPGETPASPRLTITQNWFEELKTLLP
jgi:eukaryotic-like serine/threonine-protein kinase